MINRFIAGKFRHPTGFFGRIVGNAMARNNEPAIHWTIALLEIQKRDRILEIGFGPGVGIEYAAQRATQGFIAGIDASETMVQVASHRNADAIKAGRVELKSGDVASLRYADEFFDKAMTIHCIYFWADAIACLQAIHRTLKPGGLLAITILPKDTWIKQQKPPVPPPDLFTLYNSNEVAQLLTDAGFCEVKIENCLSSNKFSGACVLGIKYTRRF
jgi:ubiquinone/menaquinone biosynthesis C-methylase UbiE